MAMVIQAALAVLLPQTHVPAVHRLVVVTLLVMLLGHVPALAPVLDVVRTTLP